MIDHSPIGSVTYHKRFRMELPLPSAMFPEPILPAGWAFVAWGDSQLTRHAFIKAQAFAGELDSQVFPNLATEVGCTNLMRSIAGRDGFCPGATWLIESPTGDAGTVQGIATRGQVGALQNLGVVAAYRGQALGAALLVKCLIGFQQVGLRTAMLEVTAANGPALALYRRHGFRCTRTIYKSTPVPGDSITSYDGGSPRMT